MKTIVLCLGNDIMADDAVGIRVAEALEKKLNGLADLKTTSVSGLYLLDYLDGYDRAVIVDAFTPSDPVPGRIRVFDMVPSDKPPVGPSPHYISLSDALTVGKRLGLTLPARITVVGIEVFDPFTIGGQMHPDVWASVPLAAETVLELLRCMK
ncbi:MAG: hydrogenase maturation protease [candidate division WOR-3 bacterium]